MGGGIRSDWYIVACPRAACPFDAEEQAREYPAGHTQRIILLADELQSIATRCAPPGRCGA